jgi:glutamate racemase
MQASQQPIGIFDSGVGGLAVARVIKDLLPAESIYYLGDTRRFPYGEKNVDKLRNYVRAIGNWLLKRECKLILIACNTATVAAADQLQEQVGPEIPVCNVVDPIIDHIKQQYIGKKLGLIGTQYTVQSNVYNQKLQNVCADTHIQALATPLLVPMVENAHYQADIVNTYLSDPQLADIDGLILGCTHYWLIKNQIAQYYKNKIAIIDGAGLLAKYLQNLLEKSKLTNSQLSQPNDRFFATKLTANFQAITKRLFGAAVDLVKLPELDA